MSLFVFLYANYVSFCVSICELCLSLCFYMRIMSLFVFLYVNYVSLGVSIQYIYEDSIPLCASMSGLCTSLSLCASICGFCHLLCFYMQIMPPFVLLYADSASFCASICRFCLLLCFYMQILPPFVLLFAEYLRPFNS